MLFRTCAEKYRQRYVLGRERNWYAAGQPSPYALGARVHQLLEVHFADLGGLAHPIYPPDAVEEVELEAQTMFARYVATYPLESFDIVAVEQVFEVPLNGSDHRYTGKFDGIIRYSDTGQLAILEHKTEKRSSNRNNPQAWAARSQVSLYKYAAECLYKEPIAHILLDVLRRQSPKGQEPPTFKRDTLERTARQVEDAVDDLIYVADRIEDLENGRNWWCKDGHWPKDTEQCFQGTWACDYYPICVTGETPELIQIQYKAAQEYLLEF